MVGLVRIVVGSREVGGGWVGVSICVLGRRCGEVELGRLGIIVRVFLGVCTFFFW